MGNQKNREKQFTKRFPPTSLSANKRFGTEGEKCGGGDQKRLERKENESRKAHQIWALNGTADKYACRGARG